MVKVLLIEDDPLMVRMYQRKLVNDGYEAAVAVDGEDGLVKIRSFRPDLVLLDIMMPKLNGLQVLERLKSDPTTAKIPVVILTNLGGTQDDVERGLELGAVAYLVKSAYRPDEVIAKVKEVLEGYTHSREIPKTAAESLAGATRVLEATEQVSAHETPKKEEPKQDRSKSSGKKKDAQEAQSAQEALVDGMKPKKSKQAHTAHPVIWEASGGEEAEEDDKAKEQGDKKEEGASPVFQSDSAEKRERKRELKSEAILSETASVQESEKNRAVADAPKPQPARKNAVMPGGKIPEKKEEEKESAAPNEMIW